MSIKPQAVIEAHMSICRSAGCTVVEDFADPCMGCPNGHFGPYVRCAQDQSRLHLGDKVAMFTQPVTGLIDHVFGTDLKNCGGCKGRQKKLNEWI